MKKILLTLSFTMLIGYALSQQQPVISQYMLNPYYFNPAYTGSGELYNFSFLHRSQWSGYKDYNGNTGAPKLQLLTARMNIDSTGHAIGVLMSRDKLGDITTYQAQLSYAYRIRLSRKSTLTLGLRGGMVTKSIDYDKYIVKHPDDDLLHQGKQSETQPDVTLGLWFDSQKFFTGVSLKGMVVQSHFSTFGLSNEKMIVGTAGYRFNLQGQWKITPTVQLMTTTHQTSVQASALTEYSNALWFGGAYRQNDAATLFLGFAMLEKKLRLNYAFDYTTGNMSLKTSTSHEVMVTCSIGKLHSKKV
jgi:type IX secretion system PorP/SprF family membrane protein